MVEGVWVVVVTVWEEEVGGMVEGGTVEDTQLLSRQAFLHNPKYTVLRLNTSNKGENLSIICTHGLLKVHTKTLHTTRVYYNASDIGVQKTHFVPLPSMQSGIHTNTSRCEYKTCISCTVKKQTFYLAILCLFLFFDRCFDFPFCGNLNIVRIFKHFAHHDDTTWTILSYRE